MKRQIQSEIIIKTDVSDIMQAFVKPQKLSEWWGIKSSRIDLKPGGFYVLIWLQSEAGIKFIQTSKISMYSQRGYLHLEDLLYITSDKGIFGPYTLKIDAESIGSNRSKLTIIHDGFEKRNEDDWYYELMTNSWPQVLLFLKQYLED